jgi:hypothetical protein
MTMNGPAPYPIGMQLEVTISQVHHRDGVLDEYDPAWVIASGEGGVSYLLYGERHQIVPQPGMTALMEYGPNRRWVLIQALAAEQ